VESRGPVVVTGGGGPKKGLGGGKSRQWNSKGPSKNMDGDNRG